jgi:hypothetical protein
LSEAWFMERTLFIIKPDAVRRDHIGAILSAVERAGLRVRGMRMLELTPEQAGRFYHVHKGKGFYDNLVAYMSSGSLRGYRSGRSRRRHNQIFVWNQRHNELRTCFGFIRIRIRGIAFLLSRACLR